MAPAPAADPVAALQSLVQGLSSDERLKGIGEQLGGLLPALQALVPKPEAAPEAADAPMGGAADGDGAAAAPGG
eukprot:6232978-Pyramimonas_sp.AAC.1